MPAFHTGIYGINISVAQRQALRKCCAVVSVQHELITKARRLQDSETSRMMDRDWGRRGEEKDKGRFLCDPALPFKDQPPQLDSKALVTTLQPHPFLLSGHQGFFPPRGVCTSWPLYLESGFPFLFAFLLSFFKSQSNTKQSFSGLRTRSGSYRFS